MGDLDAPVVASDSRRLSRARVNSNAAARFELPARFGLSFILTVSIPLALLYVHPVASQNGWWWDFLMGAGMLAAGMMIAVPLIAPRVWVFYGGNARALRLLLHLHRDVTYVVLTLVLVHIVGLVIIDEAIVEYLKLSAPWSMLAAITSSVLLLVLTVTSLYRTELSLRYRTWRVWHVGMSVAAVALMAVHVVDAGFYVNSPIKKAVFIALVAGPSLASFGISAWYRLARRTAYGTHKTALSLPLARAFSARLVVLLTILWLFCLIPYAIPEPGSRADEQANECVESICG
jgi:hypothetical protein